MASHALPATSRCQPFDATADQRTLSSKGSPLTTRSRIFSIRLPFTELRGAKNCDKTMDQMDVAPFHEDPNPRESRGFHVIPFDAYRQRPLNTINRNDQRALSVS